MSLVCCLLLKPGRNGKATVTVIEGETHALAGCEAGALQPDIGDLHPWHENRCGLHSAVVGFGAQRFLNNVIQGLSGPFQSAVTQKK